LKRLPTVQPPTKLSMLVCRSAMIVHSWVVLEWESRAPRTARRCLAAERSDHEQETAACPEANKVRQTPLRQNPDSGIGDEAGAEPDVRSAGDSQGKTHEDQPEDQPTEYSL